MWQVVGAFMAGFFGAASVIAGVWLIEWYLRRP